MPDFWEMKEEARRLNDPIVIATVAANLLGKSDFSEDEKAKALNNAAKLLWDATKIRVPPPEISREMQAKIEEWSRLQAQEFLSFDAFLDRIIPEEIKHRTPRTRKRWVKWLKQLWPNLDCWDGQPPDLKARETWNELTVVCCSEEIATLYRDERRKKMNRYGQKNSPKKS
jgi:hypothetical protein